MQTHPYDVLLVEDNRVYAHWARATLKNSKASRFTITGAACLGETLEHLGHARFDAILLDLSLPDSQGFGTFERVREQAPDTPIVVLTGYDDDGLALRAVEAGAQDYLVKEEVKASLLVRAVLYAIERQRLRIDLQHRTDELSRLNQQLATEVSERKRTEAKLKATQFQLVQSARLQSVGQLAAGVAHEVKNPLMIILGGTRFLSNALRDDDPDVALVLADITEAVQRADAIVRGLVDFSAPTELELALDDLNQVVESSLTLVKHSLDKGRATVRLELAEDLPAVRVDRNKLQQVFINLLMNGTQAMQAKGGGELTVRTFARRLTGEDVLADQHAGRHDAGRSVVVAQVDDSGTGIREDQLVKIFDPFFTTKPVGQGTGLGLSVTRKIMELHGGEMTVRNRESGGVRVSLILEPAAPLPQPDRTTPTGGVSAHG